MAKKIVLASGKGGVGKSTTAAMLGACLAKNEKRTLLIDCDAGLNTLQLLMEDVDHKPYDWLDAVTGACDSEIAVCKMTPFLSLVNAPPTVPADLPENCLRDFAAAVEKDYDFILLDAPAGLGTGLKRAALAAESALILATADAVSVQGAERTDALLRSWGVEETRLVINRYDMKAARKGNYFDIDTTIDRTLVQLIGVIPEDPALTALSVTKKLPSKSKSLAAFERISRRLQGENVSLTHAMLK